MSIKLNLRGIFQDKKYQAPYLFETTNQKEDLKQISNDGFNNPKKLVNFIGDNYNKHQKTFDSSLENELNQMNIALFGYKIEHLNKSFKKTLYTLENGHKPKGNFKTVVKLDKGLIEGTNYILLVSKNAVYERVSTSPYEEDYIYDFTKAKYEDYDWNKRGSSEVEKLYDTDCKIILSNDHAKIKYKVIFKKNFLIYNNFYKIILI